MKFWIFSKRERRSSQSHPIVSTLQPKWDGQKLAKYFLSLLLLLLPSSFFKNYILRFNLFLPRNLSHLWIWWSWTLWTWWTMSTGHGPQLTGSFSQLGDYWLQHAKCRIAESRFTYYTIQWLFDIMFKQRYVLLRNCWLQPIKWLQNLPEHLFLSSICPARCSGRNM